MLGWMDKENVVYTHTMEYYSASKKRKSAIWNSMDGSWGRYAKWNKSDRERQMPHEVTYIQDLKRKKNQHIT